MSRLPESARQHRRIVGLLCEGASNKEIGEALRISDMTAKVYVSHVLTRLGYTDRLKLATSILNGKIRALELELNRLRGGRAA